MKTNQITLTVADYCQAYERGEVAVDKTYQRSPSIWPASARSYLIETILKGFPMPKLALHQQTDLKIRQTVKYVVDGQQRTGTIFDFYSNKLTLSRSLELEDARGRNYESLTDDLQEAFLSYLLYFDQFEAGTDEDVREYFRRINSYTAPLNSEEHRHAQYQGQMKWFVVLLSDKYGEAIVNLGSLAPNSVVRKADAKLISEIVHAMLHGVTTTNKTTLDSMYRRFDTTTAFSTALQDRLDEAIGTALDQILEWSGLRQTALLRTHMFYSLLLATILCQRPWPELGSDAAKGIASTAEAKLLELAAAVESPDEHKKYEKFVKASVDKTNVKDQRRQRVDWMVQAISGALTE